MIESLKNFFYPSSICIAGASTKEKSIGYELLKTILHYGYTGKIYPVNPKTDEVLGIKCFKKINDISEHIDLAIVVVPKLYVEETIDRLISRNVKSIVLITAGFKETGLEGESVEKRITEKIKNAGGRLVGPNCMGVINTSDAIKLNATFVAEKPEHGTIAFLSQSGALGAAVLNSLRETDIRFGHFISVGNKADVSENDLLEFWQSDPSIKTISLYLESFSDGESFIKNFADGKINKPVLILKAGCTEAGMKAAVSHTGALGSSDRVVTAVINQFGICRTKNLTELFNSAKGFESFPLPVGNKIVVVTNAGGPAIIAVDALEKEGLQLAELKEATKMKLRDIVHPEGSIENPVDLLPGGTAEQFKSVNQLVADDDNVDAVVSIFVEPVMVPAFEVVENINSVTADKPILQVVMPLPEFWNQYRINSKYKTPLFRQPEEPAKVLVNMLRYKNINRTVERLKPSKSVLELKPENRFLSPSEINLLAEHYKLPLIKSFVLNERELGKASFEIGFPLVLKGLSSEVIHKSEAGAVAVNIRNSEELIEASIEISKRFNRQGLALDGFLIQPFIKAKHEILIGGFRDPSFGPMIMFGSGGKYVEVYNDTAIKSAFLSEQDIDDMISSTAIGKILAGVRGEKEINISALKEIIKSTAQLMLDSEEISELDFNPVIVSSEGEFFIVDARVKVW